MRPWGPTLPTPQELGIIKQKINYKIKYLDFVPRKHRGLEIFQSSWRETIKDIPHISITKNWRRKKVIDILNPHHSEVGLLYNCP